MELLRAISDLFDQHAPETLMAIFGAGTSLLLFYLVWTVLQHLFGVQNRTANQDMDQEQATALLIEALVTALVTEANHLRETIDSVLRETLQVGQRNATALTDLTAATEDTPCQVLALLKPEFEYLHHEMRQVEERITEKLVAINHFDPHPCGDEQAQAIPEQQEPDRQSETSHAC